MSTLPSQETALSALTNRLGPRLKAVYRVGLADSSALSDLDLVLVCAEKVSRTEVEGAGADIRGIFTEQEFAESQIYLPYAASECIYGTPIPPAHPIPEPYRAVIDLIKLACLFFNGFIRNYYAYRKRAGSVREILVHLNDFAYVPLWFSSVSADMASFVAKVAAARRSYPSVSDNEAQALLEEGIERSWRLIALLNERLKQELAVYYPDILFKGLHPSLFIAAEPGACRRYTEQMLQHYPRIKIAALPLGFSFVTGKFNPQETDPAQQYLAAYIREYVRRNLSPHRGAIPFGKYLLQLSYVRWWQVRYLCHDVYALFAMEEAYGVRQARTSYHAEGILLPAEEKIFAELVLPKDAAILDAACGGGRTTLKLFEKGYTNIVAFDNQEHLIREARAAARTPEQRASFHVADLRDLARAYVGKTFDMILVSYNGLDYLYPGNVRQKVLRDLAGLLTPRGVLLFSAHNILYCGRSSMHILAKNVYNIVSGHRYLLTRQTFGHLLTYYAGPGRITDELKEAGLTLQKIIPNTPRFFPFRDPFPYYKAVKK